MLEVLLVDRPSSASPDRVRSWAAARQSASLPATAYVKAAVMPIPSRAPNIRSASEETSGSMDVDMALK